MFAKTKGIAIVVGVLLCTLALMGGRSNVPPGPGANAERSHDGAVEIGSVLVEAFVVEVNLPALAELGVSPIGQEPHAVSVEDIRQCLEGGQARVIAGAKAAASPRGMAKIKVTGTTYIKRQKGQPAQISYEPYRSGNEFSTGVSRASGTALSVEFGFSHTRFTQKPEAPDVLPGTESWDWSGLVTLEPGTPQIAAATQDSETVVFLILTAHHQGA